ncbi:NYN domain-containing protein [Patescibacteria group bacterium]|nr:NYN domain-containing protein [Patescibacteria group bacterium]MBU4579409.1 NYN domain-containing protein [Patescibacteria group bacterium]
MYYHSGKKSMYKKIIKNYAFIDSQNLNMGIKNLGWKLDFKRFRVYLKDKYNISVAYLFIGYVPINQDLYSFLQKAGYVLIFKPTIPDKEGNLKGNIDADLVLQAMIDYNDYEKAMIITSDGDFYSLVKYFYEHNKLLAVISPYVKTCSILLKKSAKEKIVFMDNLRKKLEYIKKHRIRTKP